jgi:hypothetical protein
MTLRYLHQKIRRNRHAPNTRTRGPRYWPGLSLPAWRRPRHLPAQPHQQNGVDYINGGVGQDEQNAMRALKADYNLRLTFATRKTGAFRSDVQLDIVDAKGASC